MKGRVGYSDLSDLSDLCDPCDFCEFGTRIDANSSSRADREENLIRLRSEERENSRPQLKVENGKGQ